MTDNRTTHKGEQLQRPVDKSARAKRLAAQAKRLAKFDREHPEFAAKYGKQEQSK